MPRGEANPPHLPLPLNALPTWPQAAVVVTAASCLRRVAGWLGLTLKYRCCRAYCFKYLSDASEGSVLLPGQCCRSPVQSLDELAPRLYWRLSCNPGAILRTPASARSKPRPCCFDKFTCVEVTPASESRWGAPGRNNLPQGSVRMCLQCLEFAHVCTFGCCGQGSTG